MSTNNQTDENRPGLTGEQHLKMKKYAVFALMGILFTGCMWLIFAPSADAGAKNEAVRGFNADIPMPAEESIIGDKRDAYEQERMQQSREERMRSLADFSNMTAGNGAEKNGEPAFFPGEEPGPDRRGGYVPQNRGRVQSSFRSSAQAYRDMNRSLGSFYGKPEEDPEKEELKRQVEELQAGRDETANRTDAGDTQPELMELMEKSFRMAAKYMTGSSSTVGSVGTTGTAGTGAATAVLTTPAGSGISGKTPVVPVAQAGQQPVSALLPEMSRAEFIRMYGRPRNTDFLTVPGEADGSVKNTISACIYGNRTVMDGQDVHLRLLEAMQAGDVVIPRNTILSGTAKIQGERLAITVASLEYAGTIIPVDLRVYDLDGRHGIFIPDMAELSAAKEIVANMGTSAGTSINLSNNAGKQFAADMGRNVIQGVSQFTAKKLRQVKVHLKANYRIFLLAMNNEQ